MATKVHILITTRELIEAVWEESVAYFNTGFYQGTKIPVRKLTGNEIIIVNGTTAGARLEGEDWVVDRIGNLNARQVKKLLGGGGQK